MYWRPIALVLKKCGFFVSVVNAMLIHDFSDNSIRKVKTDKADALKIANYALTFWQDLRDYSPEDETRQMLKIQSRLYERTLNSSVSLRNGLISLLDQTFPGANRIFDEQRTKSGHIKWVDFVRRFGIKIAWQPRRWLLLQTPSQNGAKEPDTTTPFRMPNGFMILPATQLPRLLRMIAPNCLFCKRWIV